MLHPDKSEQSKAPRPPWWEVVGLVVLRLEERELSALLYLSDDSLEGFGMIDSEVSKDLTVDLDTLSV